MSAIPTPRVPGRRLLARGRPRGAKRTAMLARNLKIKTERGFTTVVVMGMMLVGMLLVAAAFAASDGDTSSARHDQYYKEAYNAADAGINWYFYHLTQDANYWSQCADMGKPVYLKNASGRCSSRASRARRLSTRSRSCPPPGKSACVDGDQHLGGRPEYRCVQGPLDRQLPRSPPERGRDVPPCRLPQLPLLHGLRDAGPGDRRKRLRSRLPLPPRAATTTTSHPAIRASARTRLSSTQDIVDGPLHSNDQLLICGHPTFGHQSTDHIETSDPTSPGYRGASGCSNNSPNNIGTFRYGAPILEMPPV